MTDKLPPYASEGRYESDIGDSKFRRDWSMKRLWPLVPRRCPMLGCGAFLRPLTVLNGYISLRCPKCSTFTRLTREVIE